MRETEGALSQILARRRNSHQIRHRPHPPHLPRTLVGRAGAVRRDYSCSPLSSKRCTIDRQLGHGPMSLFIRLFAVGAGLAWLLVIVAGIKLYWPRLAQPGDAPPFANSDWYTAMQGALWLAFLFMLTQSVLVSIDRGRLTPLETAAIICFAIGFVVTSVGFPITLIRWRRAKRAMRVP